MLYAIAYMFAFSFALSLAFSGFMVKAGLGDEPVSRSSHDRVTPTAGGIGVVAAIAGAAILWPNFQVFIPFHSDFINVLILFCVISSIGLLDDVLSIPTVVKFLFFIAVSILAVWVFGPVTEVPSGYGNLAIPIAVAWVGSVLWIFVVTNGVNFMDGANALMPGTMLVATAGLAIICIACGATGPAVLSTALAAGVAGLLPYNARTQARIFAGDVGALTVGFGYAVAVLWLIRDSNVPGIVYIGPILILPFLVDTLLTMAVRASRKENLLAPHREHLYQRLIISGRSHLQVASLYVFVSVLLLIWAMTCVALGLQSTITCILGPVLIMLWLYVRTRRRVS